MSDAALTFIPPRLEIPAAALKPAALLRGVRTNALLMWPAAAYDVDILPQSMGIGPLRRWRYLLNAPDAIAHVMIGNVDNYVRSPASIRILRPLVGEGLLLSAGETWRHQRRTIAPALSPRSIPVLTRPIAAAAHEAADELAAFAGGEKPVDLLAKTQELALAIAGRSMFSMETRAFAAEMRRLIDEYGMGPARPYLLDMLLPASIPTPRDFARRRFRKKWMGLIERIIAARPPAAPGAAPRDMFDYLIAARDPETGAAFSAPELRDQAATMITAGHETTATTLFWALYMLASTPGAQEAVAAEARALDLSPAGAHAALEKLVFTRAVVSETLRLYPPAFTVIRAAAGPDRIGGHDIRPGSLVMIAPWVLHRHRAYWSDPDVFDPSRFLPGAPTPARFSYMPFGAGPRICVGAQFAMAEAVLALAILLARFRVALGDHEPVRPAAIVTTQPDRRPPFLLRRRDA